MLKAEEAYEKSKKKTEYNNGKVLDQIEKQIEEAINQGKFEIYFMENDRENFGIGVVEDLRSRGFKIKIISPDMDEYGQMYPGYLKISWKCGREKTNWMTRFKARIAALFL